MDEDHLRDFNASSSNYFIANFIAENLETSQFCLLIQLYFESESIYGKHIIRLSLSRLKKLNVNCCKMS